MLHYSDPAVRVSAVTALTYIGNPSDIDALLDTTLALPDEHLYPAAVAVSTLGDSRLVDPLSERARSIANPTTRRVVEQLVERIRKRP